MNYEFCIFLDSPLPAINDECAREFVIVVVDYFNNFPFLSSNNWPILELKMGKNTSEQLNDC